MGAESLSTQGRVLYVEESLATKSQVACDTASPILPLSSSLKRTPPGSLVAGCLGEPGLTAVCSHECFGTGD